MPIFDFVCEDCGERKEVICKVEDREDLIVKCENANCYALYDKGVPGLLRYSGEIGSGQKFRLNGSFRLKLIDSTGAKHEVARADGKARRGGE